MKSHVILAISLVVLPHSLYSADYDVIRVFDNEFYSIANPITVDVTGIRAIFASFHSVSDKTDTQISSSLPNAQVISYNILETAALENPSIKSRLQQMKYKEKKLNAISAIQRAASSINREKAIGSVPIFVDGKTVDGEALLRLVETDALGDFPRTKSNSPGTAQFASLSSADSRVLLKLKDLHQVDFDSDATSHVSQSYTKARMAVLASSALGQSLPVNIGKVTFGTPIPRKPREIGLSVPAFESRNYDVYWIEIATTFRELNLNDIEKLKLEVVFPENAIALELLPKNITVESTDTIVTSNPTVEMEVGKVKVSIGEFYKHTVEYKNLKPTVISYGLREREFGWELSESAKQLGSHMFVAIVGVPKNAKQIPVTLSMLFKVKPKNWLLEGSVASTNPVSLNIRF